jgi:hypothetical protein
MYCCNAAKHTYEYVKTVALACEAQCTVGLLNCESEIFDLIISDWSVFTSQGFNWLKISYLAFFSTFSVPCCTLNACLLYFF